MCIICCKPKGVELPTQDAFINMWNRNPDGAGFMYATGKKVVIQKGFMTLGDFNKALSKVESAMDVSAISMVFHFRIGTAGGNIPENTHPFPITDSIGAMQKLKASVPIGVVHNGIINIKPRQKNISDTMEYIASQLAPLSRAVPDFYKNEDLMTMVGNAIDSKMAFLTKNGHIYTIGKFIEDEGLLYSNDSYCAIKYRRVYSSYWDDWGNWDSLALTKARSGDGELYNEPLMWLDEDDYIIDSETGSFDEGSDGSFLVNSDGDVYYYDYDCGIAYLLPGVSAFNVTGSEVKFKAEEAELIPTSSECFTYNEMLSLIFDAEQDETLSEVDDTDKGEDDTDKPVITDKPVTGD